MGEEISDPVLAETLKGRCSSYGFLSRLYREEPSREFLKSLVATQASGQGAAAGGEESLWRTFLQKLRGVDLQEAETALATEYAALFLNVSKRLVHPFESVYTSAERLVMQKARDEVLAEYRRAGLMRSPDFKEPEDHLALELEFMALLCRKTLQGILSKDREACLVYLARQKDFLENHLLVWVPAFCYDLEKAAQSDFYRGIARLTAEFIHADREMILPLIEEFQGR